MQLVKMGFVSVVALLVVGCGSSSSSGDTMNLIAPSDLDAVSSALLIKLGAVEAIRNQGELPEKTATGAEPIVSTNSTSITVVNGQNIQVPLNVNSSASVSSFFFKVVGSSDFFSLNVASQSKLSFDYIVQIQIPNNITDGAFCVDSAAMDAVNAVSEALQFCFTVESAIDDSSPSPSPTAIANPTPVVTATSTPSASTSPIATASPSPEVTASPTPLPSPTPNLSPTPSPSPVSASIKGSWKNITSGADFLMFTFFEDGTYLHAEIDNDPTDPSGMERGTISRNPSTGVTSVAVTFDNNGGRGISDLDGTSNLRLTVSGDVLIFEADENGDGSFDTSFEFQREVTSEFLGVWRYASIGTDFLMLAFFEDGTYLHAEIDSDPTDPSGMERGTISRNSSTGVTSVAVTFDNNGGLGFSDFDGTSNLRLTVLGDILTFEADENGDGSYDGSLEFQRE